MPASWGVVVLGDFGDGTPPQYAVAEVLHRWVNAYPQTTAMVTTGDNFYIGDYDAVWERPYGWVEDSGLEVWATPGNHDLGSPAEFILSERAFGSYPRWRTREAGPLTFVMLDSNQLGSAAQRAFLEDVVAGLGGRPWVAVFHFPWRSCGSHGSIPAVDDAWGELLSGATLVLNGHDHTYQRFRIDRGFAIVTGGGGRRLHSMRDCPQGTAAPVVAVSRHHFVGIVGRGGSMIVVALGADGAILDSFKLKVERP